MDNLMILMRKAYHHVEKINQSNFKYTETEQIGLQLMKQKYIPNFVQIKYIDLDDDDIYVHHHPITSSCYITIQPKVQPNFIPSPDPMTTMVNTILYIQNREKYLSIPMPIIIDKLPSILHSVARIHIFGYGSSVNLALSIFGLLHSRANLVLFNPQYIIKPLEDNIKPVIREKVKSIKLRGDIYSVFANLGHTIELFNDNPDSNFYVGNINQF